MKICDTERVPTTCSISSLIKISVYPLVRVKDCSDSLWQKLSLIYPFIRLSSSLKHTQVASSLDTAPLIKISMYPLIQRIDHTGRVPNACLTKRLIKISVYPLIRVKNCSDSLWQNLSLIYPFIHLSSSSKHISGSL